MRKAIITKSEATGYPYNVQIWHEVNGELIYSGEGRFCKTIDEARAYILAQRVDKFESRI